LARPLAPRFTAATLIALLPAAVALTIFAWRGAIAPLSAVAVIVTGTLLGLFSGFSIARAWRYRAERLEAVAAALMGRKMPSHLLPDDRDAISLAERHLLEAADAVVKEASTLGEQRAEFEAILRSMFEAVVVTGPRREVMQLNGAARRLFALQAETDYRGRDFVELCRDPRVQEFVGRAAAAASGEPFTAELSMQIPAPRAIEASAAPLRQNPLDGARVFVFHDVTRLRSYETVRTDFIANLTHELRTPLTALYGYAETLEKGVEDRATERRFLGIIERQARRLARLLDDLVSLSDLERGLSPLKLEALAPIRVLEEALELMVEPARRAGIALEIRPSVDQPMIHADRDRLHQVMINLIDNAIKYTPRGGNVAVQARAGASQNGAKENPPGGVEFVVTDTGEGIPATHIPRLTERFYRVDRARSRELGGTGLGLAIVKHIVQLHHGSLQIESRVREGTTVIVWLPLGREPAEARP
jgi:two-component system phosphate regulon sensor histidine kinase PhoR